MQRYGISLLMVLCLMQQAFAVKDVRSVQEQKIQSFYKILQGIVIRGPLYGCSDASTMRSFFGSASSQEAVRFFMGNFDRGTCFAADDGRIVSMKGAILGRSGGMKCLVGVETRVIGHGTIIIYVAATPDSVLPALEKGCPYWGD